MIKFNEVAGRYSGILNPHDPPEPSECSGRPAGSGCFAYLSPFQNSFIGIETLTHDEIEEYRESCAALARNAANQSTKKAVRNGGEAAVS
jgi:hypothetical protein